MKTVQMTLDADLLVLVDAIAKSEGTSRSAFTREALWRAVEHYHTRRLEERQIEGYQSAPVAKGEFDAWHDEQAWVD